LFYGLRNFSKSDEESNLSNSLKHGYVFPGQRYLEPSEIPAEIVRPRINNRVHRAECVEWMFNLQGNGHPRDNIP
jgi:hypothetical protein